MPQATEKKKVEQEECADEKGAHGNFCWNELITSDSTAAFTLTQARDLFFALDWHPSDHPPLPDIVAYGRKPDVMACGVCHRADGPGGPENASLAGLPAQYITQQMADFKSGARTT